MLSAHGKLRMNIHDKPIIATQSREIERLGRGSHTLIPKLAGQLAAALLLIELVGLPGATSTIA